MIRDEVNNIINLNLPDNNLRLISPEKARNALTAVCDYIESLTASGGSVELTVPTSGVTITSLKLERKKVAAVVRTGGNLLKRDFIKEELSDTLTLKPPNTFKAGEEIVIIFLK